MQHVTSRSRTLAWLGALYFAQGLPFGFQVTALPVFLRESGFSLASVGAASLLAFPWMFKFLWAPLVEAHGGARWGRRRSWILPSQLALTASCALGAWVVGDGVPGAALFASVVLANLAAATMDIAVDGLAIDLLRERDLGYGNIAQVVGYKIGMLVGGGLLLAATPTIGRRGHLVAMAALVFAVFIATLALREGARITSCEPALRLREVVQVLGRALTAKQGLWLLLIVTTYKTGESMSDAMLRPFLVDRGFGASEIGWWIGTWGLAFSLAGSFAGGVLASRAGLARALVWSSWMRVPALAGVWALAFVQTLAPAAVVVATCAENFFSGVLTTALFAFMMARVDRRIGAAHYAALAALEVWGKLPAAAVSGLVGESFGYSSVFGLGVVLSMAYGALLWPALRRMAVDR